MQLSRSVAIALCLLTSIPISTGCPSRPEIHEGTGNQTVAERGSGPEARAFRITREDQLLTGSAAQGRVGDWRLENRDIAIVVSHTDRILGFARSGGNVIDAGTRARNTDALGQLLTWFDEAWPRQAIYTQIDLLEPGGANTAAILQATGHDSDDPNLTLTTRYTLPPTGTVLTLETQITNTSAVAVTDFELGDALQWSEARHFAPGHGFNLDLTPIETPWLAGEASQVSYGWVSESPTMRSIHGSLWSDATIKTVQLPPGAFASYTRHLVISDGPLSDLLPQLLATTDTKAHITRGRVLEVGTQTPIPHATVTIAFADAQPLKPLTRTRSDAQGYFTLTLPEGRWTAHAESPGRRLQPSEPFTAPSKATIQIQLSQPGQLSFTLTDHRDAPMPGKIILRGLNETPNPILGPDGATLTGTRDRIYTLTGSGSVPVPPGRYTAYGARGPEYTLAQQPITITAGATTTVALKLQRIVDTTGWIAGDFHQHAAPSADSSVSLDDRVISNLAEGVELLVSTDHNHITDFAPTIERLGVAAHIASMIGNEITTTSVGHFNAYPLLHNPKAVAGGAFGPEGMTPAEIFARIRATPPLDTLIQVNHPRSGRTGFFDAMKVEPDTLNTSTAGMSWDFDALEVLNGQRIDRAQPVIRDWFAMLNRGGLFVAMGNSDTHAVIGQEPGYARTLIHLGHDDPARITPADVVTTIRHKRRAVISTGPFVTATLDGTPIGGFVTPRPGAQGSLAITVQAAPWIALDRVEVIERGNVIHAWDTLDTKNVVRLKTTLPVSVDKPSWFVVRVQGST
ncbi:MAG: CehA/McbA family metallohydrolase, partial [Myxococcota bacterium]